MVLQSFSRRPLVSSTLRAGFGWTALSYGRILGANSRVNLGLIGSGERGRHVLGQFQKTGQVDVTAVCDVYAEMIDKATTQGGTGRR
jgi:hypothetical protein